MKHFTSVVLVIFISQLGLFAQQNVGIGTNTPVSRLDINGSMGTAFTTLASGTLTLDETKSTVLASPATTINLPQASTATNRIYTIIYNGAAGGTAVVINAHSGDNIGLSGTTSSGISITEGTVILQTNGTNWYATEVLAGSGSGSYIQNQTAADQVAGFRINGNGLFNGGSVVIGGTTPGQKLTVAGGIQIGNTSTTGVGSMRWNPTTNDFEGYDGLRWISLTGLQDRTLMYTKD